MSVNRIGLVNQSMQRDDEGHRTYEVTWRVSCDNALDGPETVLQFINANFPVGSAYSLDNDSDPWAFQTPKLVLSSTRDTTEGDPIFDWVFTIEYTTKPMWRCNTAEIENPLLEPYTLGGDFVHVSREMKTDKNGLPLVFPNMEPIVGPEVEEKVSYPSITIGFNSAVLPFSTFNLLINRVNDAPMWGFPARTIRFSDCRFERVLYGVCFYYYKIQYTFECNLETFDKKIPAYGKKVLADGGIPFIGPFEIAKDVKDEVLDGVFLDFWGRAATSQSNAYIITAEIAKEGNLLLLGVPSSIA